MPDQSELVKSDTVKDIAAMANSGGGLIVFGVDEVEKHAVGRCDVGEISENYERTLRQVAVHAIHPAVFNLDVRRLGEEGQRTLALIVPASSDVPHLIYRGEYFGAPVRNNADTEWMKERQLESLYRARLEERRNSTDALGRLYMEIAAGQPNSIRGSGSSRAVSALGPNPALCQVRLAPPHQFGRDFVAGLGSPATVVVRRDSACPRHEGLLDPSRDD